MALLPKPRSRRDPVAHPQPEGGGLWDWLSQWLPARGNVGVKPINEGTTMGIPAAWRCMTFIANAVATTAPAYVDTSSTDDDNIRVDVTPAVVANPWPLMTPHEYWAAVVTSLVLYGNFYGVPADFDPDTGYPRQVIPVHPSDMAFSMVDGMPTYSYFDMEWQAGEIVHIRGHAAPGSLCGMGVITMHRMALSESVDQQEYGINMWAGAATPPWVVGVDDPAMTQDQAEKVQERMGKVREMGSKLPAVLPSNMTVSTLSFSPADAQFLESRRWNATEVAWIFGMDPADLGTAMPGASLTYANIGERAVERLTHTVGPWIRRIEQTWTQNLLPGAQHMHFQEENLLRLDKKTQTELLSQQLTDGLVTHNEARTHLDRERYAEAWADEPFGKPESAQPPPMPGPQALPAGEEPEEETSDDND